MSKKDFRQIAIDNWNREADGHNQWSELSLDEKILLIAIAIEEVLKDE